MFCRNDRIRKYEFCIDKEIELVRDGLSKAISECEQIGVIENKKFDATRDNFIGWFKILQIVENVRLISIELNLFEKYGSKNTLIKLSIVYKIEYQSFRSCIFHRFLGKQYLDEQIKAYAYHLKRKIEVWM